MSENLLSITWNNYGSTLIHNFHNFFMKESYCDATVICEGKHIKVHKIVLSACSEYFRELFENISCFHPFIILKDVSLSDFKALLEYMYNGKTSIFKNRFSQFINAADYFKVQGLSVSNNDFSSSVKISNASSESLSNLCNNLFSDLPESFPAPDKSEDTNSNEAPRVKCNDSSSTERKVKKLCVFGVEKPFNRTINKLQNNNYQRCSNFKEKKSFHKTFNTCSKEINMARKPLVLLCRNDLKRASSSNLSSTENTETDEDELEIIAVNNTNVSSSNKLSPQESPSPHSDKNSASPKVRGKTKQSTSLFTEGSENDDPSISTVMNESSDENMLEQMEEPEVPHLDGESNLSDLKLQEFRHKCLECGFSAKFPSQLRSHAKTHEVSISKRYKCGMCSYSTNVKTRLTTHVKSHKKRRKCKNCSFVSSSTICLKEHQDTCKKESSNIGKSNSDEIVDKDELPDITTTASERASHGRLGDNYFQCAFCPHITSSENLLTSHVKDIHT